MRILIVGAAGALGRATLPHLAGHEVTGTTRSSYKAGALGALGARPEICDVYDPGAIARVAAACSPDVVVNFLTDLGGGPGPANSRIRREGGPVVTAAAVASGARRLVIESIAFDVGEDAAAALAALEENGLASGLETLVLRFGRFWGPGTWTDIAPVPPAIHIGEAGRRAASLIVGGRAGIQVEAEPLSVRPRP